LKPYARSLVRVCLGTGSLDQARTGLKYSSGVLECVFVKRGYPNTV
jgi:hypothetical protein